jgi:hypothetical protein
MLSTRCKLLGGVLGFALLVAGSSPAFAQQQAQLTAPGEAPGGGTELSTCWPWRLDSESLSNQVVNSQDVSQTQQDTQPSGNGPDGGNNCDFSLDLGL